MGIKTKSDLDLKKHVALVHASGDLSFLPRKAFNVLLLQAYDQLLTKRVHEIPTKLLAQLAGYDSSDTVSLAKSLKSLQETVIQFNELDHKGTVSFLAQGSLLSWIEIRAGRCQYSFIEQMAERMYDPEVYARINIGLQEKFTSGFTLTLYENCVRYRDIRQTGWWDIDKARRLLGATAKSYDKFRKFRERVLDPSIREINAVSDIVLSLELDYGPGRGKPVVAIKFHIAENPQLSMIPMKGTGQEPARESDAYKKLRELGVSDRLALQTAESNPELALRAVAATNRAKGAGRIKSTPAAYAAGLIRARAEMPPVDDRTPTPPQASAVVAKHGNDSQRRRYEAERRNQALARISDSQRAKYLARYISELRANNPSALAKYDPAKGLKGILAAHFEAKLVQWELGDYTEDDYQQWLRNQ